MTAEPHRSVFAANSACALAAARSNWLDAFACLEVAMLRCAQRRGAGPWPRGTPFRQRLSELASLKPSPTLSKEASTKLQALVQECQALLSLRATIVHSTMQSGQKLGIEVAFFQNALDAADNIPCYVVMAEADLAESQRELRRLAQRYDALQA